VKAAEKVESRPEKKAALAKSPPRAPRPAIPHGRCARRRAGRRRYSAGAYALLGKMDESKRYAAETLRLNPNSTIKWLREHALDIPIRNEGLRKAGLLEE
jgi:hypothetical protein